MNEQTDIELLERYLAGDIDAGEVCDVEGNVLSGEALELAVKEYKDVVIQLEGAALKSRLMDMEVPGAQEHGKTNYRKWYAVAAVVALLITSGLLWQNINRGPVFEDYFDHFEQLVSFRGDTGSEAAEGIEAYSRKNYNEAFQILSGLSSSELNDELKFYLGVSALGSTHLEEAISIFEELGTEKTNKYYQQTRWYLALAYWKKNEVLMAIERLKSIEENQYKHKKALELLSQLAKK